MNKMMQIKFRNLPTLLFCLLQSKVDQMKSQRKQLEEDFRKQVRRFSFSDTTLYVVGILIVPFYIHIEI